MQERRITGCFMVKSSTLPLLISAGLILFLLGICWILLVRDVGFTAKANNSFHRHGFKTSLREKNVPGYDSRISDVPINIYKEKRTVRNFDHSKCGHGFQVYVYPMEEKSGISESYFALINVIRSSKFYTDNPHRACLFVLPFDTLDRDVIGPDYVKNLESKVQKLPYWNNGVNHLIFTLFSGTWPDYLEDMGFDYGSALLARASFSDVKMRSNFDISFPLFNKLTPIRDKTNLPVDKKLFPLRRRVFAAFKGKRYLTGIGSTTRNSFHILHNGRDMIFLTTCRHGKGWQKHKDDRCDSDNANYDRHDYGDLLENSTFCLVPRGRRLGSFRFLEALSTGCIPVVLSNGWEMPFSDIIDWKRAVVFADERSLLHLPVLLRSFTTEDILFMRQQGYYLWHSYFSSVEKMTLSTLELLRDRIFPHQKRSYHMWNYPPGALQVHNEFSRKAQDFPFYANPSTMHRHAKFTAIILATSPVRYASSSLFRLILSINQSQYVDQILVMWLSSVKIPDKRLWPKTKVALRVIHPGKKSLNSRFLDSQLVTTDAIFSFNEDVTIGQDEIDFAFKTWRSFPDRIVGFTSRSHYWDYKEASWKFSSRKLNFFSTILPNAAVYHRYYNHIYTHHLPSEMEEMVNQLVNCEGIAFNFLVAQLTKKRPILVCSSQHFNGGAVATERLGVRTSQEEYHKQELLCFKEFSRIMDVMPLQKSYVKLDPLLYKDAVSNFRKQYRLFEL